MMDRDPVQQSPSEPGESTNGTSSDPPTPPNPPRLTPNPMLLDSPAPTLTPTTSSPPPPLTPAPSVSVTHAVKAAAASPHVLVSAPPKLTSNAAPALRTYSRPILPSPKTTPPTQPGPSPSITATSAPSLHSSSAATSHTKTSTGLTNGSTRTVSTPTSTPITPFHTPASPPGRQVSQTLPVGSPALVRANQSAPPVRPRVSQQTLLLGKGQDQVLLRAQMLILTSAMRPTQSSSSSSSFSSPSSNPASSQLQSLTLKPPAALTIPSSLRLKRPLSTPPPLSSRPHTPLFPPLRPRPQPGATAPESPTMPCRHLAVPPPTLYSPVRAVPLRPRHLSPNGNRTPSPWQPAALQPIAPAVPPAAAPSSQASSPGARPLAGTRTGPLTPTKLSPGQSQSGSLSMAASPFERSPSAARQLQIIALSSGRQTPAPPGTYAHRTPAPEQPEPPGPPKRTLSSEDVAPLPANWLQPKDTPPLPSAPSPPTLRGDLGEGGNLGGRASLEGGGSQGGGRTLGGGGGQGGGGEQNQRTWTESGEEEEQMEVTDGGQTQRGRGESEVEEIPMDQEETQTSDPILDTIKDSEGPSEPPSESMVQNQKPPSESMVQNQKPPSESMVQNQKPPESMVQSPQGSTSESVAQTERPPESLFQSQKPPESMIQRPPEPMIQRPPESMIQRPPESMIQRPPEPMIQRPPESMIQRPPEPMIQRPPESMIQRPPEPMIQRPPESTIQRPLESMIQRPLEPHKDHQPGGPEDFSGNMSDNQSALSSLSSQSPPSSPFVLPPTEAPPPLHPTDLSQHHARRADRMPDAEPPSQSGDESESVDQSVSSPWEVGAWPEGRQVLTHLVEGFVIQEGLQPFPVNRSSLLVPEQVTKPPEVNGTNGGVELPVELPVAISRRQSECSTDSDEGEGGEQDEPGSKGASAHRDRAVLHCQFCGKRGHAHNFMRSKRFCSTSCARGFNVRLTKRLRALSAGSRSDRPRPILNRAESVPGKPLLLRLPRDLWSAGRHDNEVKAKPAENEEEEEDEEEEELGGGGLEEEEDDDDDRGEEDAAVSMTTRMEHRAAHRPRRASAPAVTTTTPTSTFQPSPSQWSVEEVTAFIHTLPGCSDVAEAFRLQEIDGQALLLLTEDHLMTSMNIKLGPALKICAHINTLRNL